MRAFKHAVVLSLVLIAFARPAAESAAAAPEAAFRVIVHPKNPVTEMERRWVADAFLRNVTRWPNDNAIHPVDLPPHSPARSTFSKEVLNRSVDAVRAYWQQRIFSGRGVPPPELESEDAVVSYVLTHEGAIGYVSADLDLAGAKVLLITR
jgi:ABC-type phosphate transport system substrate-binding protein